MSANQTTDAARTNTKNLAPNAYHQRLYPEHTARGGDRGGDTVQSVLRLGTRSQTAEERGRVTHVPINTPASHSDARGHLKKVAHPLSLSNTSRDPSHITPGLARYFAGLTSSDPPRELSSPAISVRPKKEGSRIPHTPAEQRPHRHSQTPCNASDPARRDSERPSVGLERSNLPVSSSGTGWEGMQREVELLRTLQDMHKASKKQAKRIEELKNQLHTNSQLLKDKENEVVSLKQRNARSESVIATVEASVQCQICMELPVRPFAMSPCGHVLCLTCLQEWFKTSPGARGGDDDDSEPALLREKTCPCCRTTVRHRPSPIFMVKAVASALLKEKELESAPGQTGNSEILEDDPWKGIFPVSEDESDEEMLHDGSSDPEIDEDEVNDWMMALSDRRRSRFSWSSDSEDEGGYPLSSRYADYDDSSSEADSNDPSTLVAPRWEPPSIHINPHDYDLSELDRVSRESALSLLRRGCSWEMIQNFNVRYSHGQGIIASLNSIDDLYSSDTENFGNDAVMYHIHLGWNITLDEEDTDGERFVHSVLSDIRNRPEQWRVVRKPDGSIEVRKLVSFNDVEEYSTTDSDIGVASDEADLD